MFVGHTAVALAAKSREPRVSLGWFVAGAYALDLLWPVFLLTGLERVSILPGATAFTPFAFNSYPWSHSLLMACVWGSCAAAIARWRGLTKGAALLVAALVVSHWVLDYVTHAPDMPLWPGNSPRVGLALWNSIAGTLAVEGTLFLVGIAVYIRSTTPIDRIGSFGLWSLLLLSAVLWASGPWSPPPSSVPAVAWLALVGGWLSVAWAAWADRHRSQRHKGDA